MVTFWMARLTEGFEKSTSTCPLSGGEVDPPSEKKIQTKCKKYLACPENPFFLTFPFWGDEGEAHRGHVHKKSIFFIDALPYFVAFLY